MPSDEPARQLGGSWIAAADRQLELASIAFERQMWNEAVALAAAATERYLEATLAAANTTFEYTHNIERLLTRQPESVREAIGGVLTPRLRQQLTDGGTVARHPGGPSYTEDECRLAVDAATAVRRALTSAVPDLFGDDSERDWPHLRRRGDHVSASGGRTFTLGEIPRHLTMAPMGPPRQRRRAGASKMRTRKATRQRSGTKISKARLDSMIEEAIVDAYGEAEQAVAFLTMFEEHLQVPFETTVLGVGVTVARVDITEADEIVAVCQRGRARQSIPILALPLPSPPPAGWEWIEAYRRWARGGRE